MRCMNCFAEIDDDSDICPICGATIGAAFGSDLFNLWG